MILFSCNESPEFVTLEKVNPNLYTINTGTSFYWCNPDNLKACIAAGKGIMPNIIRFPGGLDASFYHMDGKGYGYRRPPTGESDDNARHTGGGSENGGGGNGKSSDEDTKDDQRRMDISTDSSQKLANSTVKPQGRSSDNDDTCSKIKKAYYYLGNAPKSYLDPRDEKYPKNENVIYNVLNYCKSTSSKILFTCNMIDATYAENKKVIETILSGGVEIVGIELGNEMYLNTFQCLKYDSVATYIDTAKMYTANLRKDFPGIKVGIVAAPSEVIGINPKRLEYYIKWNKAVSKENFYDAYIVHHYMKDKNCDCKNGFNNPDSLKVKMECHQDALNTELKMWFDSGGIKDYKAMFPNKKMWLTEWSSTNLFKCFGNTQVANLYYAAYQNELVKFGDDIEFATFHNWLGNGKIFPMIAPKGKSFERRASAYVFEKLQSVFSQRETYSLEIPIKFTSTMPQLVKSYAYHQPKTDGLTGNITFIIINSGPSSHDQKIYAEMINIDGLTYRLKNGVISQTYSKSLAASMGNPGFGPSVETIQTATGKVKSELNIQGYSVTKIIYELE